MMSWSGRLTTEQVHATWVGRRITTGRAMSELGAETRMERREEGGEGGGSDERVVTVKESK